MRLEEKCPCGGGIEVHYGTGGISVISQRDLDREMSEARKHLDTWRRAHKPCLKRLGDAAPEVKADA